MTVLEIGYRIPDKENGTAWEVVRYLGNGAYQVEERVTCSRYCGARDLTYGNTHDVDLRPTGYPWTSREVFHEHGRICQRCFDYLHGERAVRYHVRGTPNTLGERD